MALERELATYEAKMPELAASQGKYVLIRGDEIVGIFEAYEDAMSAGYEKFGLEPFLVNQIQAPGQSLFVSRPVVPAVHAS